MVVLGTCDIVHSKVSCLKLTPFTEIRCQCSCLFHTIKDNEFSNTVCSITSFLTKTYSKVCFYTIVMFASVLLLMFLPLFEIKDLSEVYMFALSLSSFDLNTAENMKASCISFHSMRPVMFYKYLTEFFSRSNI